MQFYREEPTARTSWRLAVLMGANARTYKFALGAALLELGKAGHDIVSLRDLATMYAANLVARADGYPQAPGASTLGDNDFLTVLDRERAGSISAGRPTDILIDAAVRSIPDMVMQKFHNLPSVGRAAHTFYEIDGRGSHRNVRLTRDLLSVATDYETLTDELASRWSIVEAAFDAGIGRGLIAGGVELDDELSTLVTPVRRIALTSLRGAISGFQHGKCFYCGRPINEFHSDVHVDHVFPFSWMNTGSWSGPNLNHVWNLVLACASCNLGKSARLPTNDEASRLLSRNDAIADSPHPLRRTIEITMSATGPNSKRLRRQFMQSVADLVTEGRR